MTEISLHVTLSKQSQSLRKKEGLYYINLSKIYLCVRIWSTEINYLENKNGHDWVRLGWTAHGGKGCLR